MVAFDNVKLHPLVGEWLAQAAAARGLTKAGAIAHYVQQDIKAGVISPDLPGYIITGVPQDNAEPFVSFDLEGYELPDMDPPTAGFLANVITAVAKDRGRIDPDKARGLRINLLDGTVLSIGRKGGAVFLAVNDKDGTRRHLSTLPYVLASDLADQIHRARHHAQGTVA